MIIDIILDRKEGEHTGEKYDPRAFYRAILGWIDLNPKPAGEITAAMDYGTNKDVRAALCRYIDAGDYNPALKDWINAREWVEEEI